MRPRLFIISEDVSVKDPHSGIGVVVTNLASYLRKFFDVTILTVGFYMEPKKMIKSNINIFNISTGLSRKCNNIYELWGNPLRELITHRRSFALKISKFIEKEREKIGKENILVITNGGIGCKEIKKINVRILNIFHFLHSQQICSFIFPENDLTYFTTNILYTPLLKVLKKLFRNEKKMLKFFCLTSRLKLFFSSTLRYIYLYEVEPLLFADYSIVVTDDMKNYFIKNFSPFIDDPKKIVTIPNGVEEKFFNIPVNNSAVKKKYLKYGFSTEDLILLFVGRINPVKGVHYLLKILKEFEKASDKNVKMLICGTYFPAQKKYFDNLKRISVKLKKCKAIFEDFVSENKKILLYDVADIVVAPSIYDPFPLVVLEALARGKKVIASNRIGCRNLVIKGNGVVVDYSENFLQELANSLLKVSREKNIKFNKTARDAVREYGWENIIKRYLSILHTMS